VFAPELLSTNGRISVIIAYLVLCVAAIYGVTSLRIDMKIEYFIDKDTDAYQYIRVLDEYFNQGFSATFYVENTELDYASKETQL